MRYRFTKMEGLGNDFVVFDGINQQVNLTSDQIRHLADRRFGVGCDQVLLVEADSVRIQFSDKSQATLALGNKVSEASPAEAAL